MLHFNHPSCLRNRFFPKLVHPALEIIGVPNAVAVDLEKLDARDRWILGIMIDLQSGTELGPLPVQPLLSHILSISVFHGFLRIVYIMQETSSGNRSKICHKPCNLGYTADIWVKN